MKTKCTALALIILMVGASFSSFAQRRADREMREHMMAHRSEMMSRGDMALMNQLDLTEEQRSQIKQITLENRKEVIPIQNQLREKHARLRTLTTGDDINMNEAYAVIDEIGNLQTEMMKLRLSLRQDVRDLLTEDQKVIFDTRPLLNNMRMRHHRGIQNRKN